MGDEPSHHSIPAVHRSLLEMVREDFKRVHPREAEILKAALVHWRERLTQLNVLEGLDEPQQVELAALVFDLDEACVIGARDRVRTRQIRRLSDRGPGHIRKLASQIVKIVRALDKLEADAWLVDQMIADQIVPGIRRARQEVGGLDLIGQDPTVAAYTSRMHKWRELSGGEGFPFKKGAAIQLVRYLTGAGKLPSQDAQVRAAIIGNALWAWKLKIDRDDYSQPVCPAVRALVTRPTKPAP